MSSYKIPFVSLSGMRHEILIYPSAEGYHDTSTNPAIQLTGGAQPITTEEDASTDILLPVRSSTGYVRIVTDDYSLQSTLMPTTADGMRVTLVRYPYEGITIPSVLWEGYIQPTTYTQEWAGGPWEIEIPIISRLGMVMQNYLSEGNTGFLSIGQWIQRICGNVYKSVLVPDNELAANGEKYVATLWPSGREVYAVTPTAFECAFSEELFKTAIPLEDRQDSALWDPQKNIDIATSVCTTMRWVLREAGNDLIIDDPAHTGAYRRYDVNAITTRGSSYTTADSSIIATGETNVYDDSGTIDTMMPYGKVTVDGNRDGYDVTVLDPSNKNWQTVGGIPLVSGIQSGNSITLPYGFHGDDRAQLISQRVLDNTELSTYRYVSKAYGSHATGTLLTGAEAVPSMLIGNWYPWRINSDYTSDLAPDDYFAGGEVLQGIITYTEDGTEQEIQLSCVVLGKIDSTSSPSLPAVVIRSSCARCLPWSRRQSNTTCLRIEGTVLRGEVSSDMDISVDCDAALTTIPVSIKVGDYYLWKDTLNDNKQLRRCKLSAEPKVFYLTLYAKDNNKLSVDLTMEVTNLYRDDDGTYHGAPASIDAPIEMTFYTPTKYHDGHAGGYGKYIRIDNLKVKITEQEYLDKWDQPVPLPDDIDSTIYMSERIGANELEEYTVTTQFGGTESPGALFNSEEEDTAQMLNRHVPVTQVGTLPGTDGAKYLCRRTFDWLKAQGAATRRVLKVPLEASTPLSYYEPLRMTDNTATYFPAAKTTEWRDDKTTITLIEVKQ